MRELPVLPEETEVWISSGSKAEKGIILSEAPSPRSYIVSTSKGELRRNRSQVKPIPGVKESENKEGDIGHGEPEQGKTIIPPDRLNL